MAMNWTGVAAYLRYVVTAFIAWHVLVTAVASLVSFHKDCAVLVAWQPAGLFLIPTITWLDKDSLRVSDGDN
jgi:hypothetical protein